MIVYFDTSALVKLFVPEAHTAITRQWSADAVMRVVSQVAWVEFQSALALKRRTRELADIDLDAARQSFQAESPRYHRVGTDPALFAEAGNLAWQHDLRAYDAVQLASAHRAAASAGAALQFCSFDKALTRAALASGLNTLMPVPPAN